MNSSTPNRFVYEGLDLRDWLCELVSEDMACRTRAAAVISRMHSGLDEILAVGEELDVEAWIEAFNSTVRERIDVSRSEWQGWLVRLCELMDLAQARRMELWGQEQQRVDRVTDRLIDRLGANPTPQQFEIFCGRVARVATSGCDAKNASQELQDRWLEQSIAAGLVFSALREELLAIPEEVRAMLRNEAHRWQAAQALERLGPCGKHFADELLAQLDAGERGYAFSMAGALAAIVRGDPVLVREVARRLSATATHVIVGACQTLARLGPAAREFAPECIGRLNELTAAADVRCVAIDALGHVTQGIETAVDHLLSLSRDDDLWTKGAALSALGHVGRRPARVVPRLIAALDDYEEPDPDMTERSDHQRVVDALRSFGPAGAAAVPALIPRVRRSDGEPDFAVIQTLGWLGRAARPALPVLQELARELRDPNGELDEPDELVVAIRRIRELDMAPD